MKNKRNCNTSYSVYPQGGMPVPPMMPIPTPYGMGYTEGYSNNSISSNTMQEQLNNINQQINNLETRVTKLETMMSTTNNTYTDNNYYMV